MFGRIGTIALATMTAGSLVAGALLAAPALPAHDTSGGWGGGHRSGDLTTASSAMPTDAAPAVFDAVQDTVRTRKEAKAVASSTATSNCDGCEAQSTVFQIAYLDGRGAASADNSAVAWSSCVGCSSSGVSVQLVLARRAQPITVNNRALALNVVCEGCTTTAVALQFVIAGGNRRELSAETLALIEQIQAELAERLGTAAGAPESRMQAVPPEALVDEAATAVEDAIRAEFPDAASLTRSVDVQVAE